jgi:hypothetical protein
VLKVSDSSMSFNVNGKTLFTLSDKPEDSNEKEEVPAKKMIREDLFLAKISHDSIKVPTLTSFDELFELQVTTNPPNSGNTDFDCLITSAARLEHGITCLKEVSSYSTVMKQILMYFLFNVIAEIQEGFSTNHSANSHKEICKALGYVNNDSKRRLRERLHKIQYLGELTNLFGKDILLIPRLGFKSFFTMKEASRNYIRRLANAPNRKLGDRLFFEAIHNIGKTSLFRRSSNIGAISLTCFSIFDLQ